MSEGHILIERNVFVYLKSKHKILNNPKTLNRESLLKTAIIPAMTSVLGAFAGPRTTAKHLNTVRVTL